MAGLEQHLLDLIKHFLSAIGYPGVFVIMAIEGIGIPIPSEVTMPFSGFLTTGFGHHRFAVIPAIIVGAAGELTGGIIAYYIGVAGGRRVLVRYGHLILVSEEELEKAEHWFTRYGDWIVLVTRLLPAVRSFIAFPAGIVRMPLWRFVLYSAIGSTVWCAVLVLIGHALGQHWTSVSSDLRRYDIVIVIVVIALIAFAVYKRLQGVRSKRGDTVTTPVE